MTRAPARRPWLGSTLLALSVAAAPALADRRAATRVCTREDVDTVALVDGALLAEAARSLPPVSLSATAPLAAPRWALISAPFARPGDLGQQLRALRRFSVMRLWDSPHVRVFLGFDGSGRAGLHFQQRDPREWPMPRFAVALLDGPARALPSGSP